MADKILSKARNCERKGYNRTEADCPCCGRRLLIQQNSAGQGDVHCDRCALADILHAWGLDHSALLPLNGKYDPLPYGWWRETPRYAAGPVRPQTEQ